MANSYAKAGVNVEAGYDVVRRIKGMVSKTYDANVLNDLGGFGGFYALDDARGMERPVLVSGTDGVGTKLRLAMVMDKHDTVGIDCVAMCVNDIVCHGAKPLFFLDYLAVGKLDPARAAQIVSGVTEGCLQAGCALIGGETAEMPGFYGPEEYDMAGFAVGLADGAHIIDGSTIEEGDVMLGLASSGVHSNGFSLVRGVFKIDKETMGMYVGELEKTLGEALLEPTRIYVKAIQACMKKANIHGIAHITGCLLYTSTDDTISHRLRRLICMACVDCVRGFVGRGLRVGYFISRTRFAKTYGRICVIASFHSLKCEKR